MERLKYPNPQFIRKEWMSLNGEWEFCFDDNDQGRIDAQYQKEEFFDKKIIVPFSYHTKKSGIELNEVHEVVWYKKEFKMNIQDERSYLLHFGAVDYECDIWINGIHAAYHKGGHVPFTVDMTQMISSTNTVIVRVKDDNSCRQAIGKQSWKDHNFLCWYTRTVGIWQQVWIEETGRVYIEELRLTPTIDSASLSIDAFVNIDLDCTTLIAEVSIFDTVIREVQVGIKDKRVNFTMDVSSNHPNFRLHFWSPDSPNLYDLKLKVIHGDKVLDEVDSYFGMRSVHTKNSKVYINNLEFYQKLILDQGYIKDGGMSLTVEQLKEDVFKIKEMGFNGVRKHQKVEDHRFMYLCDKLGLVMWAEMPSPFEYSSRTNENVVNELYPFIAKHYNHPSVIAYAVMNESWGINEVYTNKEQQTFVNALYYLTKSLDQTRLVIGNDGWEHTITDILTIHDYNDNPITFEYSYKDIERALNGSPSRTSARSSYCESYSYQGEPFMISEYGGIAYEKGVSTIKSWGYGDRLESEEDVIERIRLLTQVLMDNDGINGFCYTQLSDVEQEVNGLLDENHDYKFDPKKIKEIMEYKHNIGFKFI